MSFKAQLDWLRSITGELAAVGAAAGASSDDLDRAGRAVEEMSAKVAAANNELTELRERASGANSELSAMRMRATGDTDTEVTGISGSLRTEQSRLQYLRDTDAGERKIADQAKKVDELKAALDEAERKNRVAKYEFENSAEYKNQLARIEELKRAEAAQQARIEELKKSEAAAVAEIERTKSIQAEKQAAAAAAAGSKTSSGPPRGLSANAVVVQQQKELVEAIVGIQKDGTKAISSMLAESVQDLSVFSATTRQMFESLSNIAFQIGQDTTVSGEVMVNRMVTLLGDWNRVRTDSSLRGIRSAFEIQRQLEELVRLIQYYSRGEAANSLDLQRLLGEITRYRGNRPKSSSRPGATSGGSSSSSSTMSNPFSAAKSTGELP